MISFTREHYYFLVVRHVGTSMAQHARHYLLACLGDDKLLLVEN